MGGITKMPVLQCVLAVLAMFFHTHVAAWGSSFDAKSFLAGRWDTSVHEAAAGDAGAYGAVSAGTTRIRNVRSASIAEFHGGGRNFVFKIQWSSSGEGQLTYR